MGRWAEVARRFYPIHTGGHRTNYGGPMTRELLFEVVAEGKHYRFYTNGDTEGFGDCPVTINYFPALLRMRLANFHSPHRALVDQPREQDTVQRRNA